MESPSLPVLCLFKKNNRSITTLRFHDIWMETTDPKIIELADKGLVADPSDPAQVNSHKAINWSSQFADEYALPSGYVRVMPVKHEVFRFQGKDGTSFTVSAWGHQSPDRTWKVTPYVSAAAPDNLDILRGVCSRFSVRVQTLDKVIPVPYPTPDVITYQGFVFSQKLGKRRGNRLYWRVRYHPKKAVAVEQDLRLREYQALMKPNIPSGVLYRFFRSLVDSLKLDKDVRNLVVVHQSVATVDLREFLTGIRRFVSFMRRIKGVPYSPYNWLKKAGRAENRRAMMVLAEYYHGLKRLKTADAQFFFRLFNELLQAHELPIPEHPKRPTVSPEARKMLRTREKTAKQERDAKRRKAQAILRSITGTSGDVSR